jgi:membrane protein DedA with SNARE-associated domain
MCRRRTQTAALLPVQVFTCALRCVFRVPTISHARTVIGGLVALLCVIALIVALALFWRKRQRSPHKVCRDVCVQRRFV